MLKRAGDVLKLPQATCSNSSSMCSNSSRYVLKLLAAGIAKGKAKSQPRLVAQLLPHLAKPLSAIGDYIEIQGREWGSCPAADKDRWFKCIVRQFDAVHEFPGGSRSAGFQVQEMGESGEGSLEPGVASGEVFWVQYPNPFLKHYYKAHSEKLPDGQPPAA